MNVSLRAWLAPITVLAGVVACSSYSADRPAEVPTDAGTGSDSSTVDGGTPPPSDAGGAADAAPSDSGADGGTNSDGGTVPTGCSFDTRLIVPFNGKNYEALTAKGKYWIFDGDTLIESKDLTTVARYAAPTGPCAGKAAATCRFDNVAFSSPLQGSPLVETITAYGKYWRFDGETPIAPVGGALVESVGRYAAGPCVGQAAGACRFDTGVFVDFQGLPYEAMSVGNRYWIFQGNTVITSEPLSNVARYAAGPCAGHAADCAFENKLDALFNGKTYETIDAYGRYWIFDGDTVVETNRHESVARYAAAGGPCAP